jgi:3-oxoacyl-[acyl-carrier protein] reductase
MQEGRPYDPAVLTDALRLDGRVALVTGAAHGIGRAVAEHLVDLGAAVALCDRSADDLAATAGGLRSSGAEVHSESLDVRHERAVAGFVAAAVADLGRLDIVVNNAGGGFAAPFEGISTKGVEALIAENFTSAVSVIRHCLPHLGPGASIVNITSVEAHRAGPGFSVYSAMKAALTNLTRSLAVELGGRRIRVNAVAPDLITTPGVGPMGVRAPLAVAGEAHHVAAAVAFLAGDLAAFVTGTVLHVDGGTHAAGGWHRVGDGSFALPFSVDPADAG